MKRSATRKTLIGVAIVIGIVIAVIVCVLGVGTQNARPITELLEEYGYASTETGWMGELSDSQRKSINDAYESNVSAGYNGDKNDWITNNVRYRKNGDGSISLVLPNNEEVRLSSSKFFSNQAETKKQEESSSAQSDTKSPKDEWANALSSEQTAAVDLAFDASVAAGYGGTKDEWLAHEVDARHDHDGNVVVRLPDGYEFTVYRGDGQSTAGDGTESDQDMTSGQDDAAGTLSALATVDTVRARPGDKDVPVLVRITGNPGVLGLTLSVSFDENALTLKSAENGEAFRNVLSMSHSQTYGNGCLFTWDGLNVEQSDIHDGTILKLYFDVSPDASAGVHAIAVRSGNSAVDNSLHNVVVTVQDGAIAVE